MMEDKNITCDVDFEKGTIIFLFDQKRDGFMLTADQAELWIQNLQFFIPLLRDGKNGRQDQKD